MMRIIKVRIIQKIYPSVGMVNPFHIGFINFMDSIKNLNVKYAVAQAIGE
jgi:hypothetical protein